jgi:dihydroorotate dehydrogenase
MARVYGLAYRTVLRRLPAEGAHRAGFGLIRLAGAIPGGPWLLRRWFVPRDPVLRVRALGLDLPGPLGLAAGFDKDARGADALGALGFAFVEVGTVTAQPQPGNPRPRMFRLPADRALINRMGFNNQGAAVAASRLRHRRGPVTVGVNIGKTKVVPPERAVADYVASARLVASVAGYVVVNVSSPNTPGLRDLQAVSTLRPLLAAVRAALDEATFAGRADGTGSVIGADDVKGAGGVSGTGVLSGTGGVVGARRRVPLLVKIAPDLADGDVDAIADLALELGLDGIIATNTTIGRAGLVSDPGLVEAAGAGGLSGAPLRARSLEVLRRLYRRTGDRLVLIAAGGIGTADDAWERITAGATLIQAYTGFIYGGPGWPRQIQDGLARKVREAGLTSIAEARGMAAPDQHR